MNFVGERRGDYVQELSYRWVGDGEGEYDQVSAGKRPNPFGCICMLGCLAIFAAVVALNLNNADSRVVKPHGGDNDSQLPTASPLAVEPDKPKQQLTHTAFHCDPRSMEPGDQVQAAFDIAFRPAGFITEGSVGTVQALLPSDDHRVVVNWPDYPQLQGSKVSRSQILNVIKAGDFVESLDDISIEPPTMTADALNLDDMVLAATSIDGHVPQGTFGYVSDVQTVNGVKRFVVDFPQLPQFSGLQVGRSDLIKAPAAGDHVKAISDIDAGVLGTIQEGSLGVVVSMIRDKLTYAYSVAWEKYALPVQSVRVDGISLEVVTDVSRPAAVRIPKGSRGQVAVAQADERLGLPDATLAVVFKNFLKGRVSITRGEVVKVPDWSAKQKEYCCTTAQVGCDASQASSAPAAAELFSCTASAQAWSESETTWCCQNKHIGCPSAQDVQDAEDAAAQDQANTTAGSTARPMFNCDTTEQWPAAKVHWCCQYQGKCSEQTIQT